MRLRGDSDRFGFALTAISKVDASLYNAPARLHVYRRLVRCVSNCGAWSSALGPSAWAANDTAGRIATEAAATADISCFMTDSRTTRFMQSVARVEEDNEAATLALKPSAGEVVMQNIERSHCP